MHIFPIKFYRFFYTLIISSILIAIPISSTQASDSLITPFSFEKELRDVIASKVGLKPVKKVTETVTKTTTENDDPFFRELMAATKQRSSSDPVDIESKIQKTKRRATDPHSNLMQAIRAGAQLKSVHAKVDSAPIKEQRSEIFDRGFRAKYFQEKDEASLKIKELQKIIRVLKTAITDVRLKAMAMLNDDQIQSKSWVTTTERDRDITNKDISEILIQVLSTAREQMQDVRVISDWNSDQALELYKKAREGYREKIDKQIAIYYRKRDDLTGADLENLLSEIRGLTATQAYRDLGKFYDYSSGKHAGLLKHYAHVKLGIPIQSALSVKDVFMTVYKASKSRSTLEFTRDLKAFKEDLGGRGAVVLDPVASGAITRTLVDRVIAEDTQAYRAFYKKGHTFGVMHFAGLDFQESFEKALSQIRMEHDRRGYELTKLFAVTFAQNFVKASVAPIKHPAERSARVDIVGAESSQKVVIKEYLHSAFLDVKALKKELLKENSSKKVKVLKATPLVEGEAPKPTAEQEEGAEVSTSLKHLSAAEQMMITGCFIKDPGLFKSTAAQKYTVSSVSAGFILVNDQVNDQARDSDLRHKTLRAFNVVEIKTSSTLLGTTTSVEQLVELEQNYQFAETSPATETPESN